MATTIGFIGLGQMGRPMAGHLGAAGHDVLAFDRCTDAMAALAGMPGAASSTRCCGRTAWLKPWPPAAC
jgi:3-hydroxyisobutyrate dehydrogenase